MNSTQPEVVRINLYNLVSQDFWDLVDEVKAETNKLHNWLKGGRGSTKSSVVSLLIIDGMRTDPMAHAVVVRRVGDTLRESVVEQYQKAISLLGMDDHWKLTLSPLQLVFTNPEQGGKHKQYIRFKGADKPKKLKSAAFKKGYVKYIHYEEAAEFDKADTFEIVNISMLRGSDYGKPAIFYTYNPPEERGNWINKHVRKVANEPNARVIHTDYRTVAATHPEWLGQQFIAEAEHMRKYNPRKYKQMYLGLDVSTGREVFHNIKQQHITEEQRAEWAPYRRAGLDFGVVDPTVYDNVYYDSNLDTLYIWGEYYKSFASNDELFREIMKRDPERRPVIADSAERRTRETLNQMGLNLVKCRKGADSINHGLKWLMNLKAIIIDPDSPETLREFTEYAYLVDAAGELKPEFSEKNNHSIDAVRYACEHYSMALKFDF